MAFAPVDPDGATLQALRSAGLRATMPRLAMATWLAGHPHSTTTITLCAGSRTEYVDRAVGVQPSLTPAADQGFAIDEADVVFWGVCATGQAADGPAPEAQRNQEGWQ